jgi:polysaccharide biosynthesis transport protein
MMLDLKTRPNVMGASKLQADDEIGKLVTSARLFLVRHYKITILLMALGLLVSVAYLKIARPSYTATAVIDIANREGQFLRQQATLTELPADIDRAIGVAKSRTLAEFVAQKLRLDKDPEFDAPVSDLLVPLRRLWSGGLVDPDALRMRAAVSSVLRKTRVTADPSGASFTIAFTSYDPEKSADIANAIADAFISSQGEADAQLHKQAADWLVGQSNALANRSKEAAAAVSDFIKKNNIILVDGKPLDQQKLEDVNKRIFAAKQKLADAQYSLDKVNASVKDAATHDILDATSAAEVLQDPSIARARERYADLTSQLQAIKRDFGKGSQKLQDLLMATKAEILAELSRLQRNALDNYRLANQNYEDLLTEQKVAAEASQHANYLDGQLKQLQGTEQNYRTLYENFLKHSAEAARELSFPVRDARISERAETPLDKSWPKPLIVLAATTLGGLVLGLGVGALRDFTDGVFRTVDQFESLTQLKCLGLVPNATMSRTALKNPALPLEFVERFKSLRRLPVWAKIKTAPNSRFVSELIAVRLALRNSASSQGARVFGVTSALAGEGKSSLVASLGVLMAHSGHRVAIVDLDFRNPTLTDLFAPESRIGISDVLVGRRTLEDVLVRDPTLGLTIAPGAANVNIMQTVELLSSAKMRECIAKLRQNYEIVLVDLPPLLPITDVKATTEFIDNYILVVEWAKTNTALVRRAIDSSPEVAIKLAGGILNKVNFKLLSKYDSLGNLYYMRPEFSRYLDHE